MNNIPILCSSCGAVVDAAAPGGLCPRCLMAGALVPTDSPAGPRPAPPTVEQVAAAFPNLEVLALIGAGGMGAVFRARQPKLNRLVALKVLPASLAEPDPAFAERFEREGQMLARLHHPNIVAVYDSGRAGDFFYLLMEHVDGVNLRQAMRASRFTPAQALAIVPRICDALQFAHDEGVLHRDIKPENILIDAKGRVKLADFGIGMMVGETSQPCFPGAAPVSHDAALTQAGTALGTPQYMAPEQREGPHEVDHRADIYSLGVVFYELLTGELPVGKFAPPSEKSETDPRVDNIVRQALENERERRQQSAGEVRTQVESVAGTPLTGNPGPWTATTPNGTDTRRLAYAALAFAAVSGLLGSSAFLLTPPPPQALVWSILATALVGILLGVPARRASIGKGAVMVGCANAVIWLFVAATFSPPTAPQPLLKAAADTARASAEAWSPPLTPGAKPNVDAIRQEAADLAQQGRYEEALQRQIWYHNHALEIDPAQFGVRLSFALSQWAELARRHPRAKEALIEVRDRSTREFAEGGGHFKLFMEISAINEQLEQSDATLALFKSIQSSAPRLARECYQVAEDLLVERGDYERCGGFITNFQERFEAIRVSRERTLEAADRASETSQASLRRHAQHAFVKDTGRLIEILVGLGRKAEAEKLRDRALAVLDVPELQSAVADAEQRVGKHSYVQTTGK